MPGTRCGGCGGFNSPSPCGSTGSPSENKSKVLLGETIPANPRIPAGLLGGRSLPRQGAPGACHTPAADDNQEAGRWKSRWLSFTIRHETI